MSNVDAGEEDETVHEPKPHLMMVVYIQEQRPDLRILDSWSDSIRVLGMFGMDACPECNSDPRLLEAYTTCASCRLVGSGPCEIPDHVLNFGIDIPEIAEQDFLDAAEEEEDESVEDEEYVDEEESEESDGSEDDYATEDEESV